MENEPDFKVVTRRRPSLAYAISWVKVARNERNPAALERALRIVEGFIHTDQMSHEELHTSEDELKALREKLRSLRR